MTDNVAIYLPIRCPELRTMLIGFVADVALIGVGTKANQECDVQVAGVKVTCKVMDEDSIERHIQGFANYALQEHQRRPSAHIVHLLELIRQVKCVLGCGIEPGFDAEGKVASFIFDVAAKYKGLILVKDSVFDSDGEPLLGSALESSVM